jgi:MerR family transcriptional regulator, light-induced transcriptional regulator
LEKYTIKDLERLSGIKAHTLRIWEQRYQILEPNRSDTNIRFYSNEDLRRLLNISILNNHGLKISKISNLSLAEISKKVEEVTDLTKEVNTQVDSLVVSMIEMDEERFEKIINNNIVKNGFEKTMIDIIYIFLEKIGLLWVTGSVNPAQEHFISNLIRNKIIVAIDQQAKIINENQSKFLIFLPEGELHEIGLLFYTYIIKTRGHKVYYLGQSVPFRDLHSIAQIRKPNYLVTSVINPLSDEDFDTFVNNLDTKFPDIPVLMMGGQVSKKIEKLSKKTHHFKNPYHFIDFIDKI